LGRSIHSSGSHFNHAPFAGETRHGQRNLERW
jgi:hypothetical protein